MRALWLTLGLTAAGTIGCDGCNEHTDPVGGSGGTGITSASGGGGANPHGGFGAGAGVPITEPENCDAFGVASMSPTPESEVFPPRGSLELDFTGPLDPATVDPTTVVLRVRESKRTVPLDFEVVGAHLTIRPQRPLGIRGRYHLEINGVKESTVAACTASYQARFFTDPNFEAVYRRWVGGVANVTHVFTWDGARQLVVEHFVPGDDGVMLTDDDMKVVVQEYNYDALWDLENVFTWNGPGDDGTWGTSDDVNYYNSLYTYVAGGTDTQTVEFYGPDGIIGSADDTTSTTTYFYDSEDRNIGRCDGATCVTVRTDPGGTSTITSTAPGPDGQWRTDDDELASTWSRTLLDPNGNWTTIEVHTLAPDGTATVSPGSLVSYQDNLVIDDEHREVRAYLGAGADGVWRTADDVGESITYAITGPTGLRVSTVVDTAGPDALLGTADDAPYWTLDY